MFVSVCTSNYPRVPGVQLTNMSVHKSIYGENKNNSNKKVINVSEHHWINEWIVQTTV